MSSGTTIHVSSHAGAVEPGIGGLDGGGVGDSLAVVAERAARQTRAERSRAVMAIYSEFPGAGASVDGGNHP
jgi:hypothetical protein